MAEAPALTATLEDYLGAIARLSAQKGSARVRDIAAALGVHKSTVTGALRSLAEKGLVNYAPYELATLTASGEQVARRMAGRYEVIRRFLVDVLALDEELAEAAACHMEHGLDRAVLGRLRLFAEFVARCPHCGRERLEAFRDYCERESAGPEGEGVVSQA